MIFKIKKINTKKKNLLNSKTKVKMNINTDKDKDNEYDNKNNNNNNIAKYNNYMISRNDEISLENENENINEKKRTHFYNKQ